MHWAAKESDIYVCVLFNKWHLTKIFLILCLWSYVNDVTVFWTILNTPLPPLIVTLFVTKVLTHSNLRQHRDVIYARTISLLKVRVKWYCNRPLLVLLHFLMITIKQFFTQLSIIETPEINLVLSSMEFFLKNPIINFMTDILMDKVGYPQKWFIAFDQSG